MKIKIYQGGVAPGDINDYHLVTNHLKNPDKNIDKLIMYAEKRYLMTLLVSGADNSRVAMAGFAPSKGGKDTVKTAIKPIPQGDMISDNAFYYRTMPRIQRGMEVIEQVGTATQGSSSEGGWFQLVARGDNGVPTITHQMIVTFRNGKQARVMNIPRKMANNRFLYQFQCHAGDTFDFATWIGSITGQKLIFGGHTTVGERSRRGYGYFTYPDRYVQHTTKQRKSFSISGDANTNHVIWYEANGEKGFAFEAEKQLRTHMLLEDEHQKWEGISTMRDQYGNLLTSPSMYDEDNQPIVAGDGVMRQIAGANDAQASSIFGPTYDDFADTIRRMKKKRDIEGAYPFFCVTGDEGIERAEKIAGERAKDMGMTWVVNQNDNIGGAEVAVGFKFRKLNIAGESVIFVENPQWNDPEKYPFKNSVGLSLQANKFVFLDMRNIDGGKKNVEILTRGREGINRNLVYHWEWGMTGGSNRPDTPVDANTFHIFKENAVVIYDTSSCGTIEIDPNS
jgi:hypothetical protein